MTDPSGAPIPTPQIPPAPLSPSDERTYAMLAHLSILLNLVTGFIGPVVPLIFYLIYKDRSRYLAYQSLQALIFQLIGWLGGWVIVTVAWTISGILSAILIGLLCMPFALVLMLVPFAALVYGVVGAIQCSQGQDFKYWLVGDWVRGTLTAM